MFFPIGDSPNLPKTAWVTLALVVVNVAVYFAVLPLDLRPADPRDPAVAHYLEVLASEHGALPPSVSAGDVFRFEHGFKPRWFSSIDALTAMFLHGGLLHLVGNMLFLWIYGDNVEHRLGKMGFLLAYLGTGFAATLGDAVLRWGSEIPSVGASGAISGVLGFYFLWFPRNRVRVFVFLFPFFINTIELSARFVLGMYLVIDNLLPLLLTRGEGGIAFGAHLGGFVAGAVFAFVLDRSSSFTQRPNERAPRELGIAEQIARGEALLAEGQPRAALAAFQRVLADVPHGSGRAAAHLGAAKVLLRGFGSPTAAYQHLYEAMEEDPSPREAAEARELLEEMRGGIRTLPRDGPWGMR